ncbi:hypothetical protein RGQ29_013467 [Quercus rubra]|uniref:Uncharacterized protein n=1 Tax=Quercus rubra TaxID=3512 RepID=A0AAN7GD91_QUERU|nr:hypothetical protein RGQ29_013467 [Quercus rubra]
MSVGPSNYLLYSNRSATYARLGKHVEALADAEKTVQLKPDWPKGYFRLGEAHFGLGHFDEAVAAYTKGLAVTTYTKGLACDPYDEGLRAGLAKVQSAISRSRAEPERKALAHKEMDFDTAIAHHTRAIELNDEDISFLLNRALTYLKMGQYVECIKDCDKAVESGRKQRSDSKMIAIALTRKGTALGKMAKCSKDYEPAIEIFQKALIEHHNPDTLQGAK